MNTIIALLNEAGYKNCNTNRERAVRNMNLLLDSGIMSLTLMPANDYNNKENGKSFWFVNNGKKRPTAYKVTLYGNTYYGHIMIKSLTRKFKISQNLDGTWNYDTNTDYYDHYKIDINDIQIRVAQLLTIIRAGNDFFEPRLFASKGDYSCGKCNGNGVIPAFSYYANGICFDCGGSGYDRNTLKSFISNAVKI